MATAIEKKQAKILNALANGPMTAGAIVKATGLSAEDLKTVGKTLVQAGLIEQGPDKTLQLVAKKKLVKKSAPTPVVKKKPAPVEDDDDEDDDEDDEDLDDDDEDDDDVDPDEDEDEDDDEDESDDDDEGDEDDPDEDEDEDDDEDDPDEDEDEDDEDEAPVVKKSSKKLAPIAAKKVAKKPVPAPAKKKAKKEFDMAFKPIDMLSNEELALRIEQSTECAEELFKDWPAVAEMLMRSVKRVAKHLSKREDDDE